MSKIPSKYFLLCVCYKSGSYEVPNVNLFEFIVLLVYCGTVLSSSANKLKQNLNAFFYRRIYSTNNDCLVQAVVDSLCLYLTFVTFL